MSCIGLEVGRGRGRGVPVAFTKLDRIGRSLPNLVEVVTGLGGRGVNLKSLD
jgi:hypothetical protein